MVVQAVCYIRHEGTDEHLIRFFFDCAISGMKDAISQKATNTSRFTSFLF